MDIVDNSTTTVNPLSIEEEKKVANSKKDEQIYYLKFSFTITYVLLLTTATITLIEALRCKIPQVRHIFNLETCISIVAGYFYGIFLAQINKYKSEGKEIDWADITKTRYIDWSITTPMMLLTLCLVLANHSNVKIHFLSFLGIVILNYIMLYIGFLGEINYMSRLSADILGFIVFFAMFGFIYYSYVYPKFSKENLILYLIYFIIWGLYGIVYMFDEVTKNTIINILDLTAKCLVGIGLWVYYTKIIQR